MYHSEDPLFSSVHAALTFAFRHQNPSPSTPLQNLVSSSGPIPRSRGDGLSLSGEFGLIVAGGIICHVCELMTGEKMTLIGRYSNKMKHGTKRRVKVVVENNDGSKSTKWISEESGDSSLEEQFKMACITLSNHPDIRCRSEDDSLRVALIARYFGMKQNMKSLSESMGFSDRWLREINKPIKETLQKIENRAIILISNKLEDRGFC